MRCRAGPSVAKVREGSASASARRASATSSANAGWRSAMCASHASSDRVRRSRPSPRAVRRRVPRTRRAAAVRVAPELEVEGRNADDVLAGILERIDAPK